MNVRHKAREMALQILYNLDISGASASDALDSQASEITSAEVMAYCELLVNGVNANTPAIDAVIDRSSVNWTVDRMPVVDRNILRIAVYELKFGDETPYKVVIDEAIELAKRFGSDDTGAFINGILDKVHSAEAAIAPDKVLKPQKPIKPEALPKPDIMAKIKRARKVKRTSATDKDNKPKTTVIKKGRKSDAK